MVTPIYQLGTKMREQPNNNISNERTGKGRLFFCSLALLAFQVLPHGPVLPQAILGNLPAHPPVVGRLLFLGAFGESQLCKDLLSRDEVILLFLLGQLQDLVQGRLF